MVDFRLKELWDTLRAHVNNTGLHSATHPNVAAHDAMGLATDAELNAHAIAADPHPNYALDTDLTAHLNDTVDAHDASAISNVPAGGIAATDVQAALNELDTEKATTAALLTGYRLFDILEYTAAGATAFTKATYAGLRAVRVRAVGGGGGGGGAGATAAGQAAGGGGGGGGAYVEAFLLAGALAASEMVTVGAGGTAAAAGVNSGGAGGDSSFGTLAVAKGGAGGLAQAATAANATAAGGGGGLASTSVGDIKAAGGDGSNIRMNGGAVTNEPAGGPSAGIGGGSTRPSNTPAGGAGTAGQAYGGGASGGFNAVTAGVARAGGAGASGVVIVELFV